MPLTAKFFIRINYYNVQDRRKQNRIEEASNLMASDSEPILGIGGEAPNGVHGQSPYRGSKELSLPEADALFNVNMIIFAHI